MSKLLQVAFLWLAVSAVQAQPAEHATWNDLVQKYVSVDGRVNYKGFRSERKPFEQYLSYLSENVPGKGWTRNRQLAWWINAYNAFTVKLILDHYPVSSIKDLNPSISIPLVNTIWQEKFFRIGGKEMSLDDIEHNILREQFQESRIHFAINCASVSCPKLLNEAYVEDKLEHQLQQQTINFINDPARNKITKSNVQLSQIFNWFRKDFTKTGTLLDFINRYSKVKVSNKASVDFMEYNWNLNE
jgi:hypothetical protein